MFNRIAAITLCLFAISCGGMEGDESYSESFDHLDNSTFGTAGGTCHVTDGPNKGKTGTYDDEGDCCDESPTGWGCTSCSDSDGNDNGKCADGPAPARVRTTVWGGTTTGTYSSGSTSSGSTSTSGAYSGSTWTRLP